MKPNPTPGEASTHSRTSRVLAASLLALAICSPAHSQTLRQVFDNPPDAARPMVRWWWFGVAVENAEILRELQQMKADGIGGAELAFVYPQVLDDPAKRIRNLPFLSPAMLSAVTYAQAAGRRLGLRIDVTLCSGWPYGGPDTPLSEAAGRLRLIELPLPASATSLPRPKLPEGDSILSTVVASGEPGHWDASTAHPADTSLSPSQGPRVAVFFVASHTSQQVKRAAVGAEGYVLDPFNKQAVATHLEKVGEPLVKAFGDTPPYAIFSDSLEAYGADWTPSLPAEFLKRRGYDLIPHLPELYAGGTPAAEKIRHDYGRTLTELVDENYLTQNNAWAIAHHTKFRSQTYGEPAVSFSSQRLAALPEGEGPQWRSFSTLRWATSANHVFGNNVTSGETFTWLHSPVFRATPLDMKAEADIDFLIGENQLIFHGWPYSAPGVPEPGWSLYAAASFNEHNPWHPVMPAVDRYITRVSALLREGEPANQIAILVPTDDAWAGFLPGKVTITGAMQKLVSPALISTILSAGYNYDFTDADAINSLGIHHPIVLLPPTDRIPLETLRKLEAFTRTGGKVITLGRAPTMDSEGVQSPELSRLVAAFPFVADLTQLPGALTTAARPDLNLTVSDTSAKDAIGFIRRRLPDADLYFVANTANHAVNATAAFATRFSSGEAWDPDSGVASPASASAAPISLAPYESRIFVFSKNHHATSTPESSTHEIADLTHNWQVNFPALRKTRPENNLTDWTVDRATRTYSGEAIYTRNLNLAQIPDGPLYLRIEGGTALSPPAPTQGADSRDPTQRAPGSPLPDPTKTGVGPGMHAFYDPPLHEAALVTINGQPAGALWHPPYALDIAKLLKSGENHIEIHVFNTALNAWSAQPPHDYKPLIAKYGDRFQMQDLDKVQPVPSGILSPIHLVTGPPNDILLR